VIVKVKAFDVPPPGAGLYAVTDAVSGSDTQEARPGCECPHRRTLCLIPRRFVGAGRMAAGSRRAAAHAPGTDVAPGLRSSGVTGSSSIQDTAPSRYTTEEIVKTSCQLPVRSRM